MVPYIKTCSRKNFDPHLSIFYNISISSSPRSKSDLISLEDKGKSETQGKTDVEVAKADDHDMGPLGFKIKKEDRNEGSWWLSRILPDFEIPSLLKPIQLQSFSLPKFPSYTISLA